MRTIRRSHGRGNASAVQQNRPAERLERAPRATSSAAVLAPPFDPEKRITWWRSPNMTVIPIVDEHGRELGEVHAWAVDGRMRYVADEDWSTFSPPHRTAPACTPHELLSALLRACEDVLGPKSTRALLRRAVSDEAEQ